MFGGYEFDADADVLQGDDGNLARASWRRLVRRALCASHRFLIASHWSEQAQRDFFGPDGEFAAPHRPMPMGTCTPVDGGYRISGQWNYCSGIPHSSHFIGGAVLKDGNEPPKIVQVVLPRGTYTILDDWR